MDNPRARAAVDCADVDPGDMSEEILVRNAQGRKPGGHGSKVILLSHAKGGSHRHSLSLPTCQRPQLNSRETGPSNA